MVTGEKNSPTAVHAGHKRFLGVQLGHPALGFINTVDWPSRLGVGQQANNLLP